MDPKILPAVSVFVAVAAAGLWIGSGVMRAQRAATDRLAVYGKNILREETLRKPLSERAVAPVILGLSRLFLRFTPVGYIRKTQRRLVLAGSPGNLDASAWVVIKVLSTVAALALWVFLQVGMELQMKALSLVLSFVLGFFGPEAWLQRKIEARRDAMRRSLPDVLDLLVISVEAGLGFDSALTRVVNTVPGALSEEFFRMLQETRVGVARRDAMRHLMERTDVDELRSFLLAMLQAEAFGVAIARVLRVQADEMRVKRRQRAQEKAFAAPVKIVFPLVFCIFPSLFIVLLGPAAIQIFETFSEL
ncbi:MAG: type II secretion system F family protein [Acidimicrobiia bacterium]